MYAEIALAKTSRFLDKLYTYAIPERLENKISVGMLVEVPFGKRREQGYVVGIGQKIEGINGIKEIESVVEESPLFDERAVMLAKWISEYCLAYFLRALKLFLPPKGKTRNSKKENGNSSDIRIFPIASDLSGKHVALTREQDYAIAEINKAIGGSQAKTFLLYGVTGSGKTEVYMRSIKHVLSLGKNAIVLVPEIGLTPQLEERFFERFQNQIALIHSGLTPKQKRLVWKRAASGDAKIVLGTRMALFAPLKNLGLIVIDEEYETSFKSEMSPRYHSREVARKMAEIYRVPLVLGSATPSIETYYQAERGEYQKLILSQRIDNRPLPPVRIVDMRSELKAKNFSVFSRLLQEELANTLSKKEQAILLMNRKGFFTFVMCRECGLTIECPRCATSLVYHSKYRQLHCGLCGINQPNVSSCPRCRSFSIKYFGAGTERIENEAKKLFPAARIIRVDRESVAKRGEHEALYKAFSAKKADIMIGTQMVAKGLDLPAVTLVGVVAADAALGMPDFRCAERAFQLLTQAAGRAGRHLLPGKVVIQTYNPEHYAIAAAARHDYLSFYNQEIEFRKTLNYPPFSSLISLLFSGGNQKQTLELAEKWGTRLREKLAESVMGPVRAAISKVRGEWRYQILLRGKDLDSLRSAVKEQQNNSAVFSKIRITVDIDPLGMP